jgi:hypothetical protein
MKCTTNVLIGPCLQVHALESVNNSWGENETKLWLRDYEHFIYKTINSEFYQDEFGGTVVGRYATTAFHNHDLFEINLSKDELTESHFVPGDKYYGINGSLSDGNSFTYDLLPAFLARTDYSSWREYVQYTVDHKGCVECVGSAQTPAHFAAQCTLANSCSPYSITVVIRGQKV